MIIYAKELLKIRDNTLALTCLHRLRREARLPANIHYVHVLQELARPNLETCTLSSSSLVEHWGKFALARDVFEPYSTICTLSQRSLGQLVEQIIMLNATRALHTDTLSWQRFGNYLP